MINIENASKTQVTISGVPFEVPEPFTEGHVLRANEANVLNQTYAENIRNNFAGVVKKAQEKAKAEGREMSEGEVLELATQLETYISEYDFGARRGTPRAAVDPVTREALNIARAKVREALKKKGISLKDFDKEKLEALATDALQRYPQIVEQARTIVEAKRSIGVAALDLE